MKKNAIIFFDVQILCRASTGALVRRRRAPSHLGLVRFAFDELYQNHSLTAEAGLIRLKVQRCSTLDRSSSAGKHGWSSRSGGGKSSNPRKDSPYDFIENEIMIEKKINKVLVIHRNDNVGVALVTLKKNEEIKGQENGPLLKAAEEIPFGFKIALKPIKKNDPVIKYGETIGIASKDIDTGVKVHIHNCESRRGRGDKK